jgi:hypothetical protein
MSLTHELSELLNLRRAGASIPDGFEAEAVAAQVMQHWDYEAILDTIALGVSSVDFDFAAEIIEEYELSCSLEDVERAILDRCEKYKREAENDQGPKD